MTKVFVILLISLLQLFNSLQDDYIDGQVFSTESSLSGEGAQQDRLHGRSSQRRLFDDLADSSTSNTLILRAPNLVRAVEDTDIQLESIYADKGLKFNESLSSRYTVSMLCEYGYVSMTAKVPATGLVSWESGAPGKLSQSISVTGNFDDINALLRGVLYSPPANFHGSDGIILKISTAADGDMNSLLQEKDIVIFVAMVDDISTIMVKTAVIPAISYSPILPFQPLNIEIDDIDSGTSYLMLFIQCAYCKWTASVAKFGVSVKFSNSTALDANGKETVRPGLYLSGNLDMLRLALPSVLYTALISMSIQDSITISFVDKNDLTEIISEGVIVVDITGRTSEPSFISSFSQSRMLYMEENKDYELSTAIGNEDIFIADPLASALLCMLKLSWDTLVIKDILISSNGATSNYTVDSYNDNESERDNLSVSSTCGDINTILRSIVILPQNDYFCCVDSFCSSVNITVEVPLSLKDQGLHLVNESLLLSIVPAEFSLSLEAPIELTVSHYHDFSYNYYCILYPNSYSNSYLP
jgi:hypothetical protein